MRWIVQGVLIWGLAACAWPSSDVVRARVSCERKFAPDPPGVVECVINNRTHRMARVTGARIERTDRG